VDKHPEVVILDPLENVRKLLDRYRQYKLIDDSELVREGEPLDYDYINEKINKIELFGRRSVYPDFCRVDYE